MIRFLLPKLRRQVGQWILAALATAACSLGHAAEMKITAEFKPTVFDPARATFTNTTPQGGFCEVWPSYCPVGRFSVSLPVGTINYLTMEPGASSADSVSFRLPSAFVDVPVVNEKTGHATKVRFRISEFSARYTAVMGSNTHSNLWTGSHWAFAPSPCTYGANGVASSSWVSFMWRVPVAANGIACTKYPTRTIPAQTFSISRVSVGYELVTPDPLSMTNGIYRGKKRFSVGVGGDFDFGNKAILSESSIDVDFELTVKHDFQLKMPADNRRAVLEPPSGWKSWLTGGSPPPVLKRDLGFSISVGAPFTVALSCASADAGRCNLSNPAGSRAPYSVLMTIPGVVTDAGGPVSRLELTTNQVATLKPAGGYVNNAQSRLHVEAGPASVREMVKHPGTRYEDVFTLTFDVQAD